MKFSCATCGAVFTIPDQKVRQAKELKFSCPKCRNAIELNKDRVFAEMGGPTECRAERLFDAGDSFQEEVPPFEAVEEGVRTAVIWIQQPSLLDGVTNALRQLNFHVTAAPDLRSALNRLGHYPYDLLVVADNPQESTVTADLLAQQVSLVPMQARRRCCLCLVSEAMSTFDRMQAFRLGMNLIINTRDLEKGKTILAQGIKEHQSSYRLLWEELEKRGQL